MAMLLASIKAMRFFRRRANSDLLMPIKYYTPERIWQLVSWRELSTSAEAFQPIALSQYSFMVILPIAALSRPPSGSAQKQPIVSLFSLDLGPLCLRKNASHWTAFGLTVLGNITMKEY